MKKNFRFVIPTCFVLLISTQVVAEAPVVNDSENYALLEQQSTSPSAAVNPDESYDDNQPALARDTNDINQTNGNVDLINKIQGLQQEVQELRGQLEVQAHDLKVLQEQQLSFYNDLDARLNGRSTIKTAKNEPTPTPLNMNESTPMQHVDANAAGALSTSASANQATASSDRSAVNMTVSPVSTGSNPADEQISYLKAYELVKNKQYDEAVVAMQTFTQKYPQGGYTANAEYWLGELYLVKHNYADAINHFSTVLQQFPSSNKYSASLLKIGYALADAGRVAEAKERLHEVMKKYPDTATANLARLKLETLGV